MILALRGQITDLERERDAALVALEKKLEGEAFAHPSNAWRVGRSVPKNLYQGDEDVGRMNTPELAGLVVRAVNGFFEAQERPEQSTLVPLWGVYAEQETVCLERSSNLVELFLKYFEERDWKMRLRNGLVLFVSSAYSKDAGKYVQLVIKEERDDTV